jgi:hypothetical protein
MACNILPATPTPYRLPSSPAKRLCGDPLVRIRAEYNICRPGAVFDPAPRPHQGKTQAEAIFGEMKQLRIYSRYLRTSELVSRWRAGMA